MRRLSLASLLTLALLASVIFGVRARADAFYTVQDLGALEGFETSIANAVSEIGSIAGTLSRSGGPTHAAVWTAEGTRDLGEGYAWAMNDSLRVVGYRTGGAGTSLSATVWESDGSVRDLHPLLPYDSSVAYDVNQAGQVVGGSHTIDRPPGFLWDEANGMQLLMETNGQAYGINNLGQVVGQVFATDSSASPAPFLWDPVDGLTVLGLPSGQEIGFAWDVNDRGEIVGKSSGIVNDWATFWDDAGEATLIGFLPGAIANFARGINEHGQVTGSVAFSGPGITNRAFIWDSENATRDLNDLIVPGSGLTLLDAEDINDNGHIVGFATNELGEFRAFLLVPIPEPSTALLFASGLVALAVGRRRRVY